MKHSDRQEHYLLRALESAAKNGDAYLEENCLYERCHKDDPTLGLFSFREEKMRLIQEGCICQEETRLYLPHIGRWENSVAEMLSKILMSNDLPCPPVPEPLTVDGFTLTDEQQQAVKMALSHRLGVIIGGAGSGKTTLIQGILRLFPPGFGNIILCAPTGKAVRNLTERTHRRARTVHSVFGTLCRMGATVPDAGLVIVDEASMLTLEMIGWIFSAVESKCRVVLVGDPGQLPAVGAGNVLDDLLELGAPHAKLRTNHRQMDQLSALAWNVRNFESCHSTRDFRQDESFVLFEQPDEDKLRNIISRFGVREYRRKNDTQVLTPVRSKGMLSTYSLNREIQALLHPDDSEGRDESYRPFRKDDRVMVIQNDWSRDVCNGDIGVFYRPEPACEQEYVGICCDGHQKVWKEEKALEYLSLAYAITVHKAQGSEYDTIILPVVRQFDPLLTRNLIYTAISRAKKKAILVGDLDALELALQRNLTKRNSALVQKVQALWKCVA